MDKPRLRRGGVRPRAAVGQHRPGAGSQPADGHQAFWKGNSFHVRFKASQIQEMKSIATRDARIVTD